MTIKKSPLHYLPYCCELIKIILSVFIFAFCVYPLSSFAYKNEQKPCDTIQVKKMNLWLDSLMAGLTTEEKIAQLFLVRAYSNKGQDHKEKIEKLIKDYGIGGLCFYQGGPYRQAKLTNHYQEISKIPLFISIDGERGLGMRLDSCISFPYQMTLGALNNDSLIYNCGRQIGKQLKHMGIDINFAPVADINNNPDNPVINMRSFGENREKVARKSLSLARGMEKQGLICTAKHFPGHGDTDTDSHFNLPLINHSKKRLDSIEIFPFSYLINNNISGIMVAHLNIPALDNVSRLPSSLSPKIISGFLKKELSYDGLVVSDALDMLAVANKLKEGQAELLAFKAGIDILLLPRNVSAAINTFQKALKEKEITLSQIDMACRKILEAKYKAGLNKTQAIDTSLLLQKINQAENKILNHSIFSEAVSILKNDSSIIPLLFNDSIDIKCISLGATAESPFAEIVNQQLIVDYSNLSLNPSYKERRALIKDCASAGLILLNIHSSNYFPYNNFGLKKNTIAFIEAIIEQRPTLISIFGNPYLISSIKNIDSCAALLAAYEDRQEAEIAAAEIICGLSGSKGLLPVSITKSFMAGSGLKTKAIKSLKHAIPEEVGAEPEVLYQIDTLIQNCITNDVFPGCQVLASKNGRVFYHKAFGYRDSEKNSKVETTDLYDLASITKIAATTAAIMRLCDEGKMDIDMPLSYYLPYLRGSNKEDLIIRDILAHQAGLQAWIPYYLNTIQENNDYINGIYKPEIEESFSVRVANNLYINNKYRHLILDTIIKSPLREGESYKYSDLGFYLLKEAIEGITNKAFDDYVAECFFRPLHLPRMGFMPLKRFDDSVIIPTEDDKTFRKQLIRGDVHDPGAAMLGGVSGHAGLFSNAYDLAVLMNMFLNYGSINGHQFIDTASIKEFTSYQFPLHQNRRGLGFDKAPLNYIEDGPVCRSASAESFGHSGFTGTYAWADPVNGLVYIFLSNRISPDANNKKILKQNVRTRIHELFYKALGDQLSPDQFYLPEGEQNENIHDLH